MGSELATTAPQAVTVNPLAIDVSIERVDAAVNEMIESAVGHVESELKRHARRREVAAAVHNIRRTRDELDGLAADPLSGLVLGLRVDSARTELSDLFRVLNPAAADEAIASVVDQALSGYAAEPETKRKKGKASAAAS